MLTGYCGCCPSIVKTGVAYGGVVIWVEFLEIAFNKAYSQRGRTLRVQNWNPVEEIRGARCGGHRSIAVSRSQCWQIASRLES